MSLGYLAGLLDNVVKGAPQGALLDILGIALIRLLNHRPPSKAQEAAVLYLLHINGCAQLFYAA